MSKHECLECAWIGTIKETSEQVHCPRCGGYSIVHWGFIRKERKG